MKKITEQSSHYNHLEKMSVGELLQHINEEDALVAEAVSKTIPQIQALVEAIEPRMKRGVVVPVDDWVCWTPVSCLRRLGYPTTG